MATERRRRPARGSAGDHTYTNGRYTPPPAVLSAGKVREPVGGSVLSAPAGATGAKKR